MARPLPVRIYEGESLVFSTQLAEPLELGRQRTTEGARFHFEAARPDAPARLVVAGATEAGVSRRHALVWPLSEEKVGVRNVSDRLAIGLPDGGTLAPGAAVELALPTALGFGRTTVRIEAGEGSADDLATLVATPPAPGSPVEAPKTLAAAPGGGPGLEGIVGWLEGMLGVLQSAATSLDFFERAARATVEVAGLSSASVLLREPGGWRTAARHSQAGREAPWRPSQSLLNRVERDRRTVWHRPLASADTPESLLGVESVVAAPILDRSSKVIGIVYGDQRGPGAPGSRDGVGRTEAMLVELVASGVAAGLARLEQEQSALAARVLMQQFFTPELARQLEDHPELLEGRDTEVSVLVADIRGFSRVSERLGPAATIEWARDVLGALSARVLEHQGVIVDYAGDEILAVWGAPRDLPDHAELACRAALGMLNDLPRLNERWRDTLGEAFDFGIGVNSGPARVGNVGSASKFKYGPFGSTVNVASRVQGASKYLKTRLIVTDATRSRLGPEFSARRLCQVRVVNIGMPVTLFQLMPSDSRPAADAMGAGYERALSAFEAGRFEDAAKTLGDLLASDSADGPTLVLMERTLRCLIQPPDPFDPVWTLPGK
jgi:adenylate cyclase